jgi:nitrogen regulatory protein PII
MNADLRANHSLIVTIVNKGMARKVVRTSKQAGAEGGTVMVGKGTGAHELKLFGIIIEPEKEVILTLVGEDKVDSVLEALVSAGKLAQPGYGIAFVVDVKKVAGICHLYGAAQVTEAGGTEVEGSILYDLIITIVNKGDSEKVVETSKKAGAEGGTILFGRGTGIHEQARLFGITIEPEKEMVLTLIERGKAAEVLDAIVREAGLNKPGKGIAFTLAIERVAGINHILNKMVNAKLPGQKE